MIAASLSLKGEELQSFCSKNGVTLQELTLWRDQALSGIDVPRLFIEQNNGYGADQTLSVPVNRLLGLAGTAKGFRLVA